ncbi:Ferrous iron transport protein B [Posidoniimonas polymericola]|uniref:Ferrous iron transport protein B n=1 Tax=Posidoniimonas polymericola TaxID=2528002 RepID=A0A5C5YHA9_9BACT|nr:ferrous iron transport protein B [Posidoniimonas polymericola]TWT74473.1 Ferrous iron transport protein B [Posidoniimonas polymericola]
MSGPDLPQLNIVDGPGVDSRAGASTVAVIGNPNAGKTSLFNRLTGLRARTANFSGTTVEHRVGALRLPNRSAVLLDLPGLYTLEASTLDEQVARDALVGALPDQTVPDAVLLVVDSTNLSRNLFLAAEVLGLGIPTIVALNMSDLADRQGLQIELDSLREELGCPVVAVSAKTGSGLDELRGGLDSLLGRLEPPTFDPAKACGSCSDCPYADRFDWAESVGARALRGGIEAPSRVTEALDSVLTHRVFGLGVFGLVMLTTFMLIFKLATVPMDLIDGWFALAGGTLAQWLPPGDLNSLITDGVIGGVGGVLVFLPQIAILFFVLALLEGTGYMARAAFVMDRLMSRVGLPGKAFVPMLSAHACAIPAIMSTRVIEDRRDRLVTILVLPLMTCSARVPVYAMVVALLFGDSPLQASVLFAASYSLGIVAAFVMAWCFKATLLPGEARPLVIELPNYRLPSLRDALLQTASRCWSFVRNAGTVILLITIGMWALATYPKTGLTDLPAVEQQRIVTLDADAAELALQQAQLEHSAAGWLGRTVQPVFAPLGFDWKMSVGVVSSFAAREVIVSTLSVLYGLGDEPEDGDSLIGAMRRSHRADGSPVFTTATCLSLLVFYVLAMQCLPTQAITARETGSWKWAALQLGYMSVLAYVAALATYQTAAALTVG